MHNNCINPVLNFTKEMWTRCLLLTAFIQCVWTNVDADQYESMRNSAEMVVAPPAVTSLQWTGGQFEFPGSSRSLFHSSGRYISKNVIATRAQIVGDTVFLALPRYKHGVPATLVQTTLKPGACETTFAPFPCWNMQDDSTCKGFQSVVDLVVDQNEVLWVLDTGIVNTLETPERKCAAKVVALSVKTGKVLKSISLEGLTSPNSRLQYVVVDYAPDGSCFVYVSDAANRAIIVYNLQADRGFRVVLPKAVSSGCKARDVLYIALIRKNCGTTELYFTYLSTNRLFSLQSEYLRSGVADGRILGKLGLKSEFAYRTVNSLVLRYAYRFGQETFAHGYYRHG